MCCLSTVIQYVQYVVPFMRTDPKWSPTHRADQPNIFYAHCPIREVVLTLCQTENRIKIIPATHERQREREKRRQSSVFYKWNAGEKNKIWRCQECTATEDTTQSVLFSPRCRCSYICSQLSTTGWGQVKHTFTLESVTDCCCKEGNGP